MIRTDVTTDEITVALSQAAERLDDLSPLMDALGERMVDSTLANFLEGSSPDGTPWAPRSQTTLDAYAARNEMPKGGPLVGANRDLSRQIFHEATADSVAWGSNLIYAAVMHMGAAQGEFGARIGRSKKGRDFFMTIPWGDIPARPFLGIGPDDETDILGLIRSYLDMPGAE